MGTTYLAVFISALLLGVHGIPATPAQRQQVRPRPLAEICLEVVSLCVDNCRIYPVPTLMDCVGICSKDHRTCMGPSPR
ncbi:hypothetical protein BKA69DRAFT_1084242 [Paraphysoderma sedebokerense]|nr:hypothetical protein BKA69DRAFT_1084242 [Paraphysoderma sedebokerense]